MKIINLVKSEFKKNFNIKKLIVSIIVLFLASLLLVKLTEEEVATPDVNYALESSRYQYDQLFEKENKTLHDEYLLNYNKTIIEILDLLIDKDISTNGWNVLLAYKTAALESDNYLIEKIEQNKDLCQTIKYTSEMSTLYDLCNNYTYDERKKLYQENKVTAEEYKKLIEEDKYYLYLDYEIKHGNVEENDFTNYIIEKKVAKFTDLSAINYLQYDELNNNEALDSYKEHYPKLGKLLEKDIEKYSAILRYSTEKNINHDIPFSYYHSVRTHSFVNAKRSLNQVYHLSFIVMLLISIMYGGIVSREHSNGTIKNIIIAPVRRWKILLSKFIYLILNMYLLLFIGFVIMNLIVGLKYGFSDLLAPKLLYAGGKVIEVNYYLDTIKHLLLFSIPLLCYLSILFFLSTVTLNTSLTVGITSVISVLSPIVWLMSIYGNFKHIVYTPIWYFDCGFVFNNDFHYAKSLMQISYSFKNGILLTLIIGIILYVLTTLIYIKKDIKN